MALRRTLKDFELAKKGISAFAFASPISMRSPGQ
jgi:hypothetical protein